MTTWADLPTTTRAEITEHMVESLYAHLQGDPDQGVMVDDFPGADAVRGLYVVGATVDHEGITYYCEMGISACSAERPGLICWEPNDLTLTVKQAKREPMGVAHDQP